MVRALLDRWNRLTGRDDGNLMFVMLFMIFAVGIVIVITATVVASVRKTAFANNYTVSRSWADAAINDAMFTLNNPEPGQTSAEAVAPYDLNQNALGSGGGVKQGCSLLDGQRYTCWRWWIPSRTDADGNLLPDMPAESTNEFAIYADAWVQSTPNPPTTDEEFQKALAASATYRKVKTVLSGISTTQNGGHVEDGRIVYEMAPPSAITNAIFGKSGVRLNGGVTVSSYDSDNADVPYNNPTGHATIASSGVVNMDTSTSANRVKIYGADIQNFADRCLGPLCQNNMVLDTKTYSKGNDPLSTDFITNFVGNPLPETLTNIPTGDYKVNGDFIIDETLTVDPTVDRDHPVTIYVEGDVVIDAGLDVNIPTDGSNPKPANLIIYSAGDKVVIGGVGASTKVAAVIYAPHAACSSGTSAGVVTYFGSIACDTFSANSKGGNQNWRMYYDDAIGRAPAAQSAAFPTVWSMNNIIERTPNGSIDTPIEQAAPSERPSFTVECTNSACKLVIDPQVGVTSYDLYRWAGAPDPNGQPSYVMPLYRTEYIDTNLNAGTRYEYFLYPKNVFGVGPGAQRVGATAPDMPKITVDNCTETTCTTSWSKFAVDGSVFQYTLSRRNLETDAVQSLLLNQENINTFTDGVDGTPLDMGTEYEYTIYSRVAYVDDSLPGGYGYSIDSEVGKVTALTLADKPVLANGVCTTDSCTFNWANIKSAKSYKIYRWDVAANDWKIADEVTVAAGTPVGSVISFTDTGLDANKKFRYMVRTINKTGNSKDSASLDLMTLPNPAINGAAVCEETTCDLTWQPNNTVGTSSTDEYGQVTYDVTYRLAGETVWSPAGTVTDPAFQKTNLLGGTNYEFRVVITNAAGNSSEIIFTGLTKPEAPAPAADCSLAKTCIIKWDAVTGVTKISGADSTGYRAFRYRVGDLDAQGNKNWNILPLSDMIDNGDGTFQIAATGLIDNVKYEFKVYAFNASGDSLPGYVGANSLPKTIRPDVACSPEIQCRLTWLGADNITTYRVYRALTGQPLALIATLHPGDPGFDANLPSYVDTTGLDYGTNYIYAVTADAGYGESKQAESPAQTVPSMPTFVGTPVCSDVDCVVSYTSPPSATKFSTMYDGGAPVLVTTTTTTITGLEPGASTFLMVAACNNGGCSNSNSIKVVTRPAGPNIVGQDGFPNEFVVKAPFTGADTPTVIKRGPGPSGPVTTTLGNVDGGGNYLDKGLQPNTEYCYTATSVAGESAVKCRYTPALEPIVTSVSIVGDYLPGNQLRVMGPADNFANLGGNIVMNRKLVDPTDGLIVDGLNGNTEYCFTLQHKDANKPTDPVGQYNRAPYQSAPTCATTVPDPPTNLVVTKGANGQAILTWDAPYGPLLDYIIEYKIVSSAQWLRYPDAEDVLTTSTIDGLVSGGQYAFRIRAKGVGGESAPSNTVYYKAAETPGAPTGLTATVIPNARGTGGTVTQYTDRGVSYIVHTFNANDTFTVTDNTNPVYLSWTAPAVNGNADVVDYYVEYRVAGAPNWTFFDDGISTGTWATVTGLPVNNTYEFRVYAVNSAGPSAPSNTASALSRFLVEYMYDQDGADFSATGNVTGVNVATDICPAGTTAVGNGTCRDTKPAVRDWGIAYYTCPSGGSLSGTTCSYFVSSGYNETRTTGGSFSGNVCTTGGATNYGSGYVCPGGWSLINGNQCQKCDPYYANCPGGYGGASQGNGWTCSGTFWVDTSHWVSYGATAVAGYVTRPAPVGWSGNANTTPDWLRDQYFTQYNLASTTAAITVPAAGSVQTHFGGAQDGQIASFPAGSVVVRYPTPNDPSTGVQNLVANMGVSTLGGVETTSGIYKIHTFNASGTLQVLSGTTANLTWNPPAALGGQSLKDYKIEYKKSTDSTWTTYPDPISTATNAQIGGLPAGFSWNFRVTAITLWGLGTPTTASPGTQSIEYLVAGGGGGGGTNVGGGGGAGGFRTGTIPLANQTQSIPITVGNGGTGADSTGTTATSGQSSAFGSVVTANGGAPGGNGGVNGFNGASGGGGGYAVAGGSGTPGEGNNGGAGASTAAVSGSTIAGTSATGGAGGGGGAGGVGGTPTIVGTVAETGYAWGWYSPSDGSWNLVGGIQSNSGFPASYDGQPWRSCTYYPTGPFAGQSGCQDGHHYWRLLPSTLYRDYMGQGAAGAGVSSAISGAAFTYASGGAGASGNLATQGVTGLNNTGNGGGGSATGKNGGNGGNGVVIVRLVATTPPPALVATGGNMSLTTVNGKQYRVHTFQTSGTFTISSGVANVEYLVVGGGGGGGARNYFSKASGGGGAGGYRAGSQYMTAGVYNVVVGTGGSGAPSTSSGANGGNGHNSLFGSIVANGGGGGAAPNFAGQSGGSGGGGAQYEAGSLGGATIGTGQGFDGGTTPIGATGAAGGGGSAGIGLPDGTAGSGTVNSISGLPTTYAKGGVGGQVLGAGAGAAATGNGGAGGKDTVAGYNGGSGIVIIRYPVTN